MSVAALEVREFQVREVDAANREFTGIAVPWDQEVTIGWEGYRESIAPGACEPIENPKVFSGHRTAIGRLTSWRDTAEGWEVTGRISETPAGEEMYTLLRDGVIDRLSIGFEPVEHTETTNEDGSTSIRRTLVRIYEVSLVPFPAYEGAKVSDVRTAHPVPRTDQENPVTTSTLTRADLEPVEESVEQLTRSVALLQANGTPAPAAPTSQFRSVGEYVKALVTGDENAKRAFEGAVSGDGVLTDQWIGDLTKLQQERTPVTNAFSTGVLPPQGLTVEYGLLEEDETDFQRQLAEGDNLVHGKVKVTTDNAEVYTAGGYSSLSIQAIERTTNINLLDTTWTALALKAARYKEALTRARVLAAVTQQTTAGETIAGDLTTAAGVVEMLLDLAEHYDGLDLGLNGLFVAKDVFLALYGIEAPKSILQVSGAGEDKIGTLSIDVPEADLAGIKVSLFPNAPAGTIFGYDSTAVKTLEAPGAPFRITNDLNVVDLTKPIGMYTYISSFAQRPAGIVPVVSA